METDLLFYVLTWVFAALTILPGNPYSGTCCVIMTIFWILHKLAKSKSTSTIDYFQQRFPPPNNQQILDPPNLDPPDPPS